MRAALCLPVLMLAACSEASVPGEPIPCRLHGRDRVESCGLAWQGSADFTLHHPDGGFRRLTSRSGTIAPRDGAEGVTVEAMDGKLRLGIGGDRYDVPAGLLEDRP